MRFAAALRLCGKVHSNVELKLKYPILSFHLQRTDRDDGRIIVCFDKFLSADAKLCLTWLDSMVLHSPALVGCSGVNKIKLQWDGRWDVPHTYWYDRVNSLDTNVFSFIAYSANIAYAQSGA